MREIRFRAWDKDSKVMKSWEDLILTKDDGDDFWLIGYKENACITSFDHKQILMQYTGLKDKNGVEIYEGDIIKCTSKIYDNFGANETGEYEETIKQVIWKEDSWGTRVINSNLTSKGAENRGLVISAKYAEIIGNIYEKNDLLEG